MIGRAVAVAVHWVAELFAPVEKRAQSYATMGGADRLAVIEERTEVLEPWHDSGPAEWTGPTPTLSNGPTYKIGASDDPNADVHLCTTWDGQCHCPQAPESSAGFPPLPAADAPGPSSPADKAAGPGHSREPREVSELTWDERDAVWQCEEISAPYLWNALYRWNPSRGFWEYNKSGRGWEVASAGDRDVSAKTINPAFTSDSKFRFTEVLDHPDLLMKPRRLVGLAVPSPVDELVDDLARVLAEEFARNALVPRLGPTATGEGIWDFLDDNDRDIYRGYAWVLLSHFDISRK